MGVSRLSGVNLEKILSFIHCYMSITLDTHSDKQSLGCAILLTNTPGKQLENPCLKLFLAKLCKGKNFPSKVTYYLESKRHSFDFIKSKQQNARRACKTLQSLSHFIEIMTAGGSPSHHTQLRSFAIRKQTSSQVEQLRAHELLQSVKNTRQIDNSLSTTAKSIRIIAVYNTHKTDNSLSTNTSNSIKSLTQRAFKFKTLYLKVNHTF
jgi:hypothetical protein